jgi:multiple sugar transport system permease protein
LGGNDWLGKGGTGLFDSYPALLVLGMVNISMVFLVRMSIESMTSSVEEAAIMDGAGIGTILFRIVLPMQRSIFAFIAIMTFMGIWADWFTPFVFNQRTELQTIASGIVRSTSSILSQHAQPNWPELIGEGVVLNLPCILIFLAFQKNIVAGLTSSAVKG